MALTATDARTQLTEALAALSRARKAQSYSVDGKAVQRQTLEAAQADVAYWEKRVNELEASEAGRDGSSFFCVWD